jgi:hypothetical protein
MEEGSPIFSHLFSSPLTHQAAGGSGHMTAVDELDYHSERRALKLLLEKSSWVDIRWKSSHCNITNFLDTYTNCKIMHFTGKSVSQSVSQSVTQRCNPTSPVR